VTLVSDRFDSKLSRGHRVEIVTPEGVPLVFAVSSVGERVYAFVFDLMVLALVVLGLLHLMLWVMFGASGWLFALMTLLFFLLRNGWFTFFELIWQGRTPGKRRAHLRVIDAQGGALRPIAVVVRNLTRELEIFLPIYALTQPGLVGAAGARDRAVVCGALVGRDPAPSAVSVICSQWSCEGVSCAATWRRRGRLNIGERQLSVYASMAALEHGRIAEARLVAPS
jgi:uncharacterized RDD family membrane protein YckC